MDMRKAQLFTELEQLLIDNSVDTEELLKYIFDYFSADELERLVEHIKKELE